MKIIASKRVSSDSSIKFSKELFRGVSSDLTVFSEEEWESYKDNYKEVQFAVYARTDTDNLVLLLDKDKFASIKKAPFFVANSGLYPNILVDSGLICGKSFIDFAFDFKSKEAMERLVAHSICYPVGAVETSEKYVLVFNIVLSESLLRDPEISLKQGLHFYHIETLHTADSLQKAISESLIIVKSEDKK